MASEKWEVGGCQVHGWVGGRCNPLSSGPLCAAATAAEFPAYLPRAGAARGAGESAAA